MSWTHTHKHTHTNIMYMNLIFHQKGYQVHVKEYEMHPKTWTLMSVMIWPIMITTLIMSLSLLVMFICITSLGGLSLNDNDCSPFPVCFKYVGYR